MKLRPYQDDIIKAILERLKTKNEALLYASVGAGKTVIMSKLASMAVGQVLITVPRIALIDQTVNKLKIWNDDIGVFCASLNRKEIDAKIVVGSIQSMRDIKKDFSLIMVDECHMFERQYLRFLKNNGYNKVLGLSGTPFKCKKEFWGDPVAKLTIKDLTDLGYLAPIVFKSSKKDIETDLVGVTKTGGDYNLRELAKAHEEKLHLQIPDALERLKNRKRVLWVCVNVKHAESVKRKLSNSAIVTSKMSRGMIEAALQDFRNGRIRHLISVAMVNVGFDVPEVDALVMMRATRSTEFFIQTVGRALRKSDSKENALILDYGKCIEDLGHPYEITDRKKKPGSGKTCSQCQTANLANAKTCFECGATFYNLCEKCGERKPYAEECKTCEKEKKKKKSNDDSLTEKAFEGKAQDQKKFKLKIFSIRDHTSKAGRKCKVIDVLIDCKFSFDGPPQKISNYYPGFLTGKFYRDLEKLRNAKEVTCSKSKGYWRFDV